MNLGGKCSRLSNLSELGGGDKGVNLGGRCSLREVNLGGECSPRGVNLGGSCSYRDGSDGRSSGEIEVGEGGWFSVGKFMYGSRIGRRERSSLMMCDWPRLNHTRD